MDTTTQFDLNQAILDWRKALANSPAIRRADLEELESHLRDSVVSLQAAGLATHEAFWVARGRLGAFEALNDEFGKVNIEQVWLDRVLWMVTGCIAFGLGTSLLKGLIVFTALGMFKLTTPSSFLGPVSLILSVATLAASLFFLWRSGRNKDGLVWRAGYWLKARPRSAGVIALLLTALSSAVQTISYAQAARLMPYQTFSSLLIWHWPAGVIGVLFWPIFLAWLLARKSPKQSSSRSSSVAS
jgi:hypothetical protein